MKYLRLFESFESEIHEICKKYHIHDYTINKDGTIDVDGYVQMYGINLTILPLKFNKVGGISCTNNKLISLEGSPIEVNGDFSCQYNLLTSFKGSPKIIRGYFCCNNNNIKTFEYFPIHVGGSFYCSNNPIYKVWYLFQDTKKIELLNDFDIFRDEDTDKPVIIMDRLNDFLLTIGRDPVEKILRYKNI